MKLITRYNRINISATIIVFLVASISYYFIVRYVLIHQLDNTLKVEEAEILNYVKTNNRLPEPTDYRDQHTSFAQTQDASKRRFSNIKLFERYHHENNHYRELSFPIIIDGKLYKASVTKSEEEMEDLVKLIVIITAGVIILLMLILFITNRVLLRRLWEPFYNTLESIKAFTLSNKREIPSEPSHIDEFNELAKVAKSMQSRIIKDYETLKEFADNASHEMQTPLAILNSKLDLLIQEPDLSERQTKQLQGMYDAISRLTKLNQSLLLLTKIENNQFAKSMPLQLDTIVKEKLAQLEDLIMSKHLHVNTDLKLSVVNMNVYLADILLNNLIGNAIRHNYENGNFNISTTEHELRISNTGAAFSNDAQTIFDRFKKGASSEGIGLGLALVKQICDNYSFVISYQYNNNMHCFTLTF
jgi:signal transduction histidine kinase